MEIEKRHHENIVAEFKGQLEEIFDTSEQAIYLYLDDEHKACNRRFAHMLGYSSPEEWAAIRDPMTDVDEGSRETLVSAYEAATAKRAASQIEVRFKTKTGRIVDTSMIVVPVAHQGHLFALHFISEKGSPEHPQ